MVGPSRTTVCTPTEPTGMSHRYESLGLHSIAAGCKHALDVGCGNGELTRDLPQRQVPEVIGLDRDEHCLQRCSAHPDAGDIRYIAGASRNQLDALVISAVGFADGAFRRCDAAPSVSSPAR